jgi:predicted esterase YcpF (UPF0227 family)
VSGTYLYLHGFASGPTSFKAQFFSRRFGERGVHLQVPSLDEGDFAHLTLSRQRSLVERMASGASRPLVLIGSSLGGYLAALHASAHPVDALLVMAPAVDFARRLEQRSGSDFEAWRDAGFTWVDHYGTGRKERLSFDLIVDAAHHDPCPRVEAPMLVLHGRTDDVVPLAVVERWAAAQPQARLVVFESGHELKDVVDAMFDEMVRFLEEHRISA